MHVVIYFMVGRDFLLLSSRQTLVKVFSEKLTECISEDQGISIKCEIVKGSKERVTSLLGTQSFDISASENCLSSPLFYIHFSFCI